MFKKIILEYVKEGILEIKDKTRFEEELENSDLNDSLIVTKQALIDNSGQHLEIGKYINRGTGKIVNLSLENMEEYNVIADIDLT